MCYWVDRESIDVSLSIGEHKRAFEFVILNMILKDPLILWLERVAAAIVYSLSKKTYKLHFFRRAPFEKTFKEAATGSVIYCHKILCALAVAALYASPQYYIPQLQKDASAIQIIFTKNPSDLSSAEMLLPDKISKSAEWHSASELGALAV